MYTIYEVLPEAANSPSLGVAEQLAATLRILGSIYGQSK